MKRYLISLFAVAVMATCALEASAQATGPLSAQTKNVGFDQKLDVQVPADLSFHDEYGKPVKLGDYFGKRPVILNLVYYQCPMMCTEVLNGLVNSLRQISLEPGRDFEIVTVSFDPTETPDLAMQKKKTYVEGYGRAGAAEGWHFLTGDEATIKRLTDTVGFRYIYDERSGQYAHAAGILVLTPAGKTSKYFYGITYVAKDLRLGLVDASNNRIGSPVDYLLLLCYHYDPLTGKYSFAVIKTLRLAAVLTILIVGGAVGLMLLRERRTRAHPAETVEQAH